MKRTLLILCALLAMAYSAGTQAQNVWDGTVAGSFAGGSGTAEDPYQIADGAQLKRFAAIVNGTDGMTQNTAACGKLTADILLNAANTWTPIGNNSQPFTGTLDGDGHSVSGIYINSSNNCQGFFGATNGATITNLHTTQGYIRGNGRVGGIVGNAEGGSIEDCTNGCTIASTGSSNGGIIGNGMGVQITGCTNNGPLVAGQYQNGGIAGTVENSTIDQCVNNADITVNDHAGGIAGYNTNGTVSNCLNKGNVNTSNAFYTYTAGIVANNRGTGSVVKNCLNLGTISGQGGTGCRQNSIVCATDASGTPADNCYSINTSGVSVGLADNSRDVTEEELESGIIANLLQGNQEELIWGQTIGADNSPVLGGPEVFIYGDGTCGNAPLQTGEGGFYLISNADELRLFASMVNSGQTSINGKLTADILLNDTTNWKTWETTAPTNSWTPIGSDANRFTGTLDGDGHSVSGIYINSEADYQGLVGFLDNGGTLQNVGVKASYIKGGNRVGGVCGDNYGTVSNCYNTGSVEGYSNVGGVCGLNDGGTVTNCYNSGSVAGTGSTVGGVCGYNNRTVTNCYNTGSVTGTDSVGGLCGLNDGGTVTNCYNSGSVAGTDYVGGVCGDNNISGTISNCYNTGSVTGSDFVGGVCGLNYGIMTNCYNTGSVEGYSNVGGVCGMNMMGNVINCYNSGSVAGTGGYVGGLCGENYATVTNCYNSGSVAGSEGVGGLCGYNDGTVTNCYNTGSVEGDYSVGGVCGYNDSGPVTNCYNTGSVTGNYAYVGGLCGQNYATVTNCYNTGSVSGNMYVGGVCGNSWGNVTNCYYLDTCGAAGEGTSKNADEFASGEVTWLLQNEQAEQVWGQTIGTDEYPVLGGEKVYQYNDGTYGNTPLQAGEGGFYLISTADELRLFASMVNSGQTSINGRLTADIVLNDTTNWKTWNESTTGLNTWTPIGNSWENPFTGTLDGDGHSVSGIYINSTADDQGLVGVLGEGGTLQDLGVKASYIKGTSSVGGLCGRNDGTVTNCYNTGNVTGTGDYAGGLCGTNYGTVTNCYNTGSVTGSDAVGGLCGRNDGTVTNCYNNGNITGSNYVGGLCGWNSGTLTNCYNTGSVTGNGYVGGVCGRSYATVSNCYNTGSVEGNDYVGGVCGSNEMGYVTNCYNTGNVKGNNYVGGVCGDNHFGTVTNCYNTGNVTGNNQVGGVCGWNSGTVTNCYYLAGTANSGIGEDYNSGEATEKTADEFASGEVAWLLQGEQAEQVWGQAIGTDEYPVLGGEKVLQIGNGYVNELKQDGDFYLISTANELRLFASMVNGGQTSINGKLTADILLNDTTNGKHLDADRQQQPAIHRHLGWRRPQRKRHLYQQHSKLSRPGGLPRRWNPAKLGHKGKLYQRHQLCRRPVRN